MPSCSVKSCKHNSRVNKKSQGITYHRFPEKNTEWYSYWCKIIRESRGQKDWVPAKSSVICNVHFKSEDLYVTKNGIRRLANHAIPTIHLSEASKVSVIKMAPGPIQTISIDPQPVVLQNLLPPIITGGWATLSEQLPSFESTCPQNESVILPQTTTNVEVKTEPLSALFEPSDSSDSISQPPLIIDEEPRTYQPCDSTAEPLTDEFIELPPDVANDWDSLNTESLQRSIGLAQNIPFEASYPESDDSLPPLIITEFIPQLPPQKDGALSQTLDAKLRYLEAEIKGKNNLLDSHVQKIKLINQKIRRLEKRNAALKRTLKTMKDKLFDDSELSNGLDQKVTGADIFNHFNKYRRQHNINYTPAIKKFCLTLNSYSPKAYDYIRHTLEFCLPHFRTLTKWQDLEDQSEYTDESSQENFH